MGVPLALATSKTTLRVTGVVVVFAVGRRRPVATRRKGTVELPCWSKLGVHSEPASVGVGWRRREPQGGAYSSDSGARSITWV